jgi:hypothetical protein
LCVAVISEYLQALGLQTVVLAKGPLTQSGKIPACATPATTATGRMVEVFILAVLTASWLLLKNY